MAPDLDVNIRAFVAFLQDRSEVWVDYRLLGQRNNRRGLELVGGTCAR